MDRARAAPDDEDPGAGADDDLRDDAEAAAWIRLAVASGLGPRTCGHLVRALGGPREVARASAARLASCPGVGRDRAERLRRAIAEADPRAVRRAATDAGCAVAVPGSREYPARLASSPDPPAALFVRGRMPGEPCGCAPGSDRGSPGPRDPAWVAVVGTRAASPYGVRVARSLAEGLARAGVVVVSGLARGIDGVAHAATIAAGGTTVAVLGCGPDVAYPPEHAALAAEVAAHGAIVSEHPPGTPPHPGHFPRRNRIVAALANAVVVVEAGASSGACLTARIAAEIGREVLAVPGPVDRDSHRGCHRLLREGARLCEGLSDVLRAVGGEAVERADEVARAPPSVPPAAGPPLLVWSALDRDDATSADEVALRTGLSADAVAAALTVLEMDGRVVRAPGGVLRA